MPWRVLAFALGIWGVQCLPTLPAPAWVGLLAGLGLPLWLAGMAVRDGGRLVPLLAGWIGALLLGVAWAGGFAHWRLADALPAGLEGREIEVTGVVAELPHRFEHGVRFVFAVGKSAEPLPGRIVLSWYRHVLPMPEEEGDDEAASPGHLPLPRAGERWRFLVRLKPPHGHINPHGFDFEGWLFERDLRAVGYVRKSTLNVRLDEQAGGPVGIERLRERARDRIRRALPGQPYAGILAALAVGDQQAIPAVQWRLFSATGITHLMSISGLHVTMIGGLCAGVLGWFWRRSARLPLFLPTQKAAAIAGLAGAFFYAWLAGFGVPAQRTLYMLGVVALALLVGRSVSAVRVLGAALLLVLLLDPWAVLAAGFWLSFAAVALLFYIGDGRMERRHWLSDWLRAQWAMTLGLIPLLLALFQQFSLVSPLANALAIPLVSLLITPLALLGCLPGFAWSLEVAHGLLLPLMDFLAWLATMPGAIWQQHAPPAWAVPLALFGTVWLFLPRGFPARWLGLVLFLPLFLIPPARPLPGALAVTVLDVGQGQAVHVRTATRDLLFDTGPGHRDGSDAGHRVLLPYLRAAGVTRLDQLIVSHADRDHSGGMESLLAGLTVDGLLTSIQKPLTFFPEVQHCRDGQSWEWDGIRFRILHPAPDDYAGKRPTNAMSCVLKIESAYGNVLIPGDLEGKAEAEFLVRHGAEAHAEVLVAPHHGGKKTSTPAFVAAVGAREAVFPVGYRNRFGHPYPSVLERYAAAGTRLHRTDIDGAVSIDLNAQGISVRHEREERRRYWHNGSFFPESGVR